MANKKDVFEVLRDKQMEELHAMTKRHFIEFKALTEQVAKKEAKEKYEKENKKLVKKGKSKRV